MDTTHFDKSLQEATDSLKELERHIATIRETLALDASDRVKSASLSYITRAANTYVGFLGEEIDDLANLAEEFEHEILNQRNL